jgi:Rieske Fe-S protein
VAFLLIRVRVVTVEMGNYPVRERRIEMAQCEVCGNEYDKAFEVTMPGDQARTFDSFECAIHALAPTCAHCGVKVIGHGVEADGRFFCCAHCARMEGAEVFTDRV